MDYTLLIVLIFFGLVLFAWSYEKEWMQNKDKFDGIVQKTINKSKKKNEEANLDKKLDRLQKLGQLLKDGVITKEEFEEQKKKIEL